jgi:hypothetical protein
MKISRFGKMPARGKKHGRMAIMTTSMHAAGAL